ncbi:MAG: NhaC family Na+:H+ antiporter, partial [Roseivirga sp.]
TLIIFLIMGFVNGGDGVVTETDTILTAITSRFYISGWLFLVPLAVVVMIVKKVPAAPAILIGALLGAFFALIFQPEVVQSVANWEGASWEITFVGIMKSLYGEISIVTGNEIVDELLTSGGMHGMLGTVWLILSAMIFGGVMESTGLLKRIAEAVISRVHSTGSTVAATAATTIFFNTTASDQYLAIVVPGRMYADIYRRKGLAPENLSRTLEDSGTVTSVLVPWNTCGAYHSNVLGVATLDYLPYAFFNLISPLMTIAFAYLNIKIRRIAKPNSDKTEIVK